MVRAKVCNEILDAVPQFNQEIVNLIVDDLVLCKCTCHCLEDMDNTREGEMCDCLPFQCGCDRIACNSCIVLCHCGARHCFLCRDGEEMLCRSCTQTPVCAKCFTLQCDICLQPSCVYVNCTHCSGMTYRSKPVGFTGGVCRDCMRECVLCKSEFCSQCGNNCQQCRRSFCDFCFRSRRCAAAGCSVVVEVQYGSPNCFSCSITITNCNKKQCENEDCPDVAEERVLCDLHRTECGICELHVCEKCDHNKKVCKLCFQRAMASNQQLKTKREASVNVVTFHDKLPPRFSDNYSDSDY